MKALIDLGTNTFNLMIADIDAAGLIHVIHSERKAWPWEWEVFKKTG